MSLWSASAWRASGPGGAPAFRLQRAGFTLALLGVSLCLPGGEAASQAHQPPKVEVDAYEWEFAENPFSGDAQAIAEGRRLYRSTCSICHADTGSRGPNLRKSKLEGQDFLKVVINGRKNTQMPAWKGKLSEAEMWKIYSFLQAPLPGQ